MDTKPLEGRVAQILSERELVINIGGDAGVEKGMKFAVLAESPNEILDPNTGELLDKIDREKVRVEASEVRPKITVCRTYKSYMTGGSVIPELMKSFQERREVKQTLRIRDSDVPPPLSEAESYVKVKDRVIQVYE